MSESIRLLHTQRVKLNLNNIKTNKTNVEKEWENLQNILKLAAYKWLGYVKRQNKKL